MKRIYISFLCLMTACFAHAVPAVSTPIEVTLANGEVVSLYVCGDEYGHYYTQLDGTPVRLEDGQLMIDYDIVTAISQQQKKPGVTNASFANDFPLVGSPRALVLLIEYTDVVFKTPSPNEAFSNMLNQSGYAANGATGSVRDYFIASSDSAFSPIFDVYGPYQAANKMAYYGGNTWGGDNISRVQELVREACTAAEEAGVDFSQYDNDGDGYVDNIFLYYAGHNEAEGGPANTIWPHRYGLDPAMNVGGMKVSSYMCTSELRGYSGTNMAGIGTFCHEFGHVLGLPDLYNTRNQNTYTVGYWDLMCSGSYNNQGRTPPTLSAFERFMLGWLQPQQLSTPQVYRLLPLETSNTAYLIAARGHNLTPMSPNPSEYFLIENRQEVGWDANGRTLPGVGLLISHITFNTTGWYYNTFNNNAILGYDIVEAYNKNATSSGSSDTYPGSKEVVSMIPTLNNQTTLDEQSLTNITQLADKSVAFQFGVSDGTGFSFNPQQLPTLITTYDNRQIVEYIPQTVEVVGKEIIDTVVEISVNNSFFEFSPDQGTTWYKSKEVFVDTITNTDGTYMRTLLVRHKPTKHSCDTEVGVLSIATRDVEHIQMNKLALTGSSPRPTYIKTPENLYVSKLTPISFVANWDNEEDADFYYATLYTKIDTPIDVVQGFETFETLQGVREVGWEMNFLDFSTAHKNEGERALYFSQTGQIMITEDYREPITRLSFWLGNDFVETTTGTLYLTAKNTRDVWYTVREIPIQSTEKDMMHVVNLPADSAYVQFKLTYEQSGTDGGVMVDSWTAHMERTVQYIYKNQERLLYAPRTSLICDDLTWGETYYFQIQAYEEKDCEPHLTKLSKPLVVTTSIDPNTLDSTARIYGAKEENRLTVVAQHNQLRVFLLSPSSGDYVFYVYNLSGQLITQVEVPIASTIIEIPTSGLSHGEMYFVKYAPVNATIKRKDYWGKFIW